MNVAHLLAEALPGRVVTDTEELARYRTDRSGHMAAGTPLAAVHARSIDDVQVVCRIAYETGTPVVTRGAGTGLAGGGIADSGEIVLCMGAMQEILEISTANRLAVVQPGILNGALNEELAGYGLWWPPDPASKDVSTVGGNIAMNAGGLLCAKYGVTREAVLALKVVLADGRLISVGHRTVKGVTGYDVCALMIGSEGTLGIIVECTLKLQPAVAGTRSTIGAFFPALEQAIDAVSRITEAGLVPAIMELLDRRTLECVGTYTAQNLLAQGSSYLLVQCDGPAALPDAEAVAGFIEAAGGTAFTTMDPDESARLVNIRRQAFPALESMGTMLVEDVAVPRDRVADMFRKVVELEDRYDIMIPTACHAGDGNLHPSFVYQGATVPDEIWSAAGELFAYALELGGTLSGEHGIGLLKRRWLGAELGDDLLDIQRQIKTLFDPRDILNPGKVFPASL
ncbi:FAD-linked oxidase C-terminal domain-containing protein [Cryobacterium sp. PH29-G1]|uniref:FAD-binding oxidoreductase n=1 Tax=Cryobacterium sp. PH29-G1 TaxID=3046211 RepID=UPI0024B8AB08|nr:FAD-linked oxidase C-terminal domain-containing protein [Cryobacterium sp. PH29-G1]MDJ0350253.1 FAD-linked oxidase C-terminal domain-containing protein [Cryobacterium sp. PH29-G1]